jgi:hypothetical protein
MTEFEMSIPNLGELEAKIAGQVKKFDDAALFAIGQVGLSLEVEVKRILNNNSHKSASTAKGRRWIPKGHIGSDGTPPNRRTGALIRSVYTNVRQEPGSYVATVFPTMVYARSLELGNPSWKSGVKYPYLVPAFNNLRPRMAAIFERGFARKMGG